RTKWTPKTRPCKPVGYRHHQKFCSGHDRKGHGVAIKEVKRTRMNTEITQRKGPADMNNITEQEEIAEINKLHQELQGLATGALDRAIRLGELLSTAKRRLPHGQWLPW